MFIYILLTIYCTNLFFTRSISRFRLHTVYCCVSDAHIVAMTTLGLPISVAAMLTVLSGC